MDLTAIVAIGSLALALIGTGVAWLVHSYKLGGMSKQNDADHNAIQASITTLTQTVSDLKNVVGNGGTTGLRQNLQVLREHCAAEMSRLNEKVNNNEEDIKELKGRRP